MRLAALALLALLAPATALTQPFGFAEVERRARELAGRAWQAPRVDLPKTLKDLTYDQHRDIRFRPERSLWRADGLPFEVAFFHMGGLFDIPVKINEITAEGPRPIAFDERNFNYGANSIDKRRLAGLGFAGFRVHYPINTPRYKDEVLAFLGASYFRALGKDQRYGLSARGLAIDTGLASGEEFPVFTEFWIERPAPDAKELRIFALLDSRSVAGAYRFVLRPGADTAVDVKARIFARRNVAKLGVAPLTSMFLFGENQRASAEDYRPEVHDSDGLSVQLGTGEWVWRPLSNPKRLLVTSFGSTNPQGFGLMQRDRNFASYEDLEARYELRPSAWIRPLKPFGPGRVELVQIPSPFETNDNIVAFWSPRDPPQAKQHMDLEYQILWQRTSPSRPPSAWVAQTRRGPGFTRVAQPTIDFHIDFEGPMLRKLTDKSVVTPVFTPDANGEIVELTQARNPVNSGVRISLRVKRLDATKPLEIRGFLRDEVETHSETWSFILPPE